MNNSTASIEDPRFVPAQNWFETLQQQVIAAMEALEREFAGVGPDRTPGQFVIESWERTDASGAPGGGGRMAMLRGRLFEKMGVHSSLVHGAFPAGIRVANSRRRQGPALLGRRRFGDRPSVEPACADRAYEYAARAHDQDMVWRRRGSDADARRAPQGGRSGRRRLSRRHARRVASAMPASRTPSASGTWCDEYFYLKHRKEPRGIGGIFFDYLNSAGDAGNSAFDADFAFVRDVGESFLAKYTRHCPSQRRETMGRRPSASDNWCAGDVTLSSICSMIAARSSA